MSLLWVVNVELLNWDIGSDTLMMWQNWHCCMVCSCRSGTLTWFQPPIYLAAYLSNECNFQQRFLNAYVDWDNYETPELSLRFSSWRIHQKGDGFVCQIGYAKHFGKKEISLPSSEILKAEDEFLPCACQRKSPLEPSFCLASGMDLPASSCLN